MKITTFIFMLLGNLAWGQPSKRLPVSVNCDIVIQHFTVKSNDDLIQVDLYRSPDRVHLGNIFGLHSAAGVLASPTSKFDDLGQFAYACAGYDVYIPHYIQAVGLQSIDNVELVRKYFSRWSKDLLAVYYDRLSNRGPNYLVGESLGAYLALAIQAKITDLRALSILSVGYRGLEHTALPFHRPILIQHGEKDSIISIQDERDLVSHLLQNKCRVTSVEYSNVGHNLLWDDRQAVLQKSLSFLFSSN